MTAIKKIASDLKTAERFLEVHYSRHAAVSRSEAGCVICEDLRAYIWLQRTALNVAGILGDATPRDAKAFVVATR